MSIQLPAQLQPIATNAGPWSRPWYEWAWRVTDAVNSGGGGGGGAPTNASYVTLGPDATLTNERVLTAGAGITVTDGGAGGPVTVACTVTSGAPTNAQYVTLATNGSLSAERVLTAGAGISITDGGANGPVTVAAVAKGATVYLDFGATAGTRLTATVVDAAVTPASIVLVSWGAVQAGDDNDPELDDITFFATPAAGSFDVTATCATDISGACRLNYTVF